jgi:hypothetical protein
MVNHYTSNYLKKATKMKVETEVVNKLLQEEMEAIMETLKQKNTHYDSAALRPINVFAGTDPMQTIRVRIDDKLSRLKHFFNAGTTDSDGSILWIQTEDTLADLIGYLLLLRVGSRMERNQVRVADTCGDSTYAASPYDPLGALYARLERVESKTFPVEVKEVEGGRIVSSQEIEPVALKPKRSYVRKSSVKATARKAKKTTRKKK